MARSVPVPVSRPPRNARNNRPAPARHGLRVRGVSKSRGMLFGPHCHVSSPGRPLYPSLRVLCHPEGQSRTIRLYYHPADSASSPSNETQLRGSHVHHPRRPPRWRGNLFCGSCVPNSPRPTRRAHRGAHPRFPR
ncbi:MAG: hypothetical protein RBG13Loki_2768 [Promethearchaeota archaeon CR_4]|nr:MAG: hypothetical protein RBG13Loki_2768 [Candidatus Lokiarchaeota archaeon CR_4]